MLRSRPSCLSLSLLTTVRPRPLFPCPAGALLSNLPSQLAFLDVPGEMAALMRQKD